MIWPPSAIIWSLYYSTKFGLNPNALLFDLTNGDYHDSTIPAGTSTAKSTGTHFSGDTISNGGAILAGNCAGNQWDLTRSSIPEGTLTTPASRSSLSVNRHNRLIALNNRLYNSNNRLTCI